MPGHRVLSDWRTVIERGDAAIADPGASGTFALKGKTFATVTVTATGTYTLPNAACGTVLYVTTDDTSVVTLADSGGTIHVFTGTSGTSGVLCIATDRNSWAASRFAQASAGALTAANVSVADAGNLTSATTAEAAIAALLRDAQMIRVPMTTFVDADGDPLAKFVDNASPNPGFALANSEAYGIRWNNNATQAQPVLNSVVLSRGVTSGSALTMHIIASKTGATVGDATTFTVTAFENFVGSLHDAGGDLGSVSTAMTGNATAKTVQHVTVTLALVLADTAPAYPSVLTFSITPTSGTLGTDDVIIESIYFTWDGQQ